MFITGCGAGDSILDIRVRRQAITFGVGVIKSLTKRTRALKLIPCWVGYDVSARGRPWDCSKNYHTYSRSIHHSVLVKAPVVCSPRAIILAFRYLGSAVAMLVFPYVVEHFGPVAEFRCAGLIAIAWLVLWSRVGFDLHDGASVGDGRDQTSSKESDDIVAGGKLGSAGGWATDDEDTSSLIPKQDDNKLALIHARSASLILRSPSPPLETRISVASSNAVAVGGVGSGAASSASIPWGVMASSPAVWAILTSNFAFHYATYVLMNWLPTYYQKHLNLSLNNMGNLFKVNRLVT